MTPGSEQLTRGTCWSFKCDESPDGWVWDGRGNSQQVCEEHGRSFVEHGWDHFELADDGLRADGGAERFEDPNGARSTCARCGDWLDDLEQATAPFGLCFSCSDGGGA